MEENPGYDKLFAEFKALEERVKRYRSFTENASDLLYRTDTEGKIVYLSKSVTELSGYTMEEAMGLDMAHDVYLVPAERDKFLSILQKEGKVNNFTARLKRKDGSVWWALTNAHVFRDPDGRIGGVEGITRDITALKQAEEKLRVQAKKIKAFFNALNDAIFVHPMKDEGFAPFIEVNEVACERYGYSYEEFLRMSAPDITQRVDADTHAKLDHRRELIEKGRLVFETVHIKKSGERFPVEISSNIIHDEGKPLILAVVRDITERKRLEAQMRKIEQLEAVATLSGGIAHEFNNSLNVVSGNIELLQMALSDHNDLKTFSSHVEGAIERLKKLTNQLHAYARGGKYNAGCLDLSDFVKRRLPDIESELGSGVVIDVDLAENVPSVNADPDQLRNVLAGVLSNAAEASEAGGRILVRTFDETVDASFAAGHPGIVPGRYAVLSVRDEGRGMDEETRRKIFDPFFTTKFQGRGLGMAAVYGVVKNHGGYIYVDSEPGKGTTVNIYIPPMT